LIVVVVPHVLHGASIPFAETFAEFPAGISLDRWVFVHFMVIGIPMVVFDHIVPGCFNAFVEAAALRIAVFRWRLLPAVLIMIVVLNEGCAVDRLSLKSMRLERPR
jgi:hypothetical protein